MHLYHGSSVTGLTTLQPGISNHDKAYVYLTDCPTLALFYAHNPIARPGGFFPYWFDRAGQLHYDEYFPHQTQLIYQGYAGWVYHVSLEKLPQLDKMPWVYLSECPIKISSAEFHSDLYTSLLQAEHQGHLVIHRYETIPEAQQEQHRKVVQRSLEGHIEDDYVRFLRQYMPELF